MHHSSVTGELSWPSVHQTMFNSKVQAVNNWPVPTNASSLHQFLSYYWHYIAHFSTITAPLTTPIQEGLHLNGPQTVMQHALYGVPVLAYPNVSSMASSIVLQTDTSAYGLSAILEQNNHVIADANGTTQAL